MTYVTVDILRACKDGSKRVYFRYYRAGMLWYETDWEENFPVPTDDVGNATMGTSMPAIQMMRWMRKWNNTVDKETMS